MNQELQTTNAKNTSTMWKDSKKAKYDRFFGKGNYTEVDNRILITNHVIDEDRFVIVTNNVTYWKNKDVYVLWVNKDKVIYLKDFQLLSALNKEWLGMTYIVKLNRKYFKSYSAFTNDYLEFYGEYTFDELLEIARTQDKSCALFRIGYQDAYGNSMDVT